MKQWVCELGGYEHLLDGVDIHQPARVQAWQQWYLRFGHDGHPPITAGPGIAEHVKRYEDWLKIGSVFWGHPNTWGIRWPIAWEERLTAEDAMRELTGWNKIHITANNLTTAGPRARRRR